ncbi:MAG: response regulator [Desulfobacterales bacterium]
MASPIPVLMVDDEAVFLTNMAHLLEDRGFSVQTASSGWSALEFLSRSASAPGGTCSVVVLDISMPGIDGIETLRRIRSGYPDVDVIMLTGQADLEAGIRSIRNGAYDFLMKPCDVEDLAEKLREACGAGRIRRRPVLWPRTRIGEILRQDAAVLKPGDSAAAAVRLLSGFGEGETVDRVYVVDSEGRLVGVLARRALVGAAEKICGGGALKWEDLTSDPASLSEVCSGEIAQAEVCFSSPQETIREAAQRMIEHRKRILPVIYRNRFVGTVRLQDALLHLTEADDIEEVQGCE